ncbi:MAG TPA: hypothetical protein VF331_15045 [Polyangiales bacterium]
MRVARSSVLAWLCLACACSGTTGGQRVAFSAVAVGAAPNVGKTLEFDNSVGYHVTLTRAHLHVGAIYLNQSVPSSGAQETACVLPGIYVAEVFGPLDVDALSAHEQSFPYDGEGIRVAAKAAELWLAGGDITHPADINDLSNAPVILDVAGTAEKNGGRFPFEAQLTIGDNRAIASSDPAYPGANPICKQRIVTPIAVNLTPENGGKLVLRVDPRKWFSGVDFSLLPRTSQSPLLYRFADAPTQAADVSLYGALHSRSGVYQLTWE